MILFAAQRISRIGERNCCLCLLFSFTDTPNFNLIDSTHILRIRNVCIFHSLSGSIYFHSMCTCAVYSSSQLLLLLFLFETNFIADYHLHLHTVLTSILLTLVTSLLRARRVCVSVCLCALMCELHVNKCHSPCHSYTYIFHKPRVHNGNLIFGNIAQLAHTLTCHTTVIHVFESASVKNSHRNANRMQQRY